MDQPRIEIIGPAIPDDEAAIEADEAEPTDDPPLRRSERAVIAHLFEVVFGQLHKRGLLDANVCIDCVHYETDRLREGHDDD